MLVGRSGEFASLTAMLDHTRGGSGSVVLLMGQAGIGKTTLAAELLVRAKSDGWETGLGRAWDGPGSPAFFVWLEAFASSRRELEFPRTLASEEARFAAIEKIARHARSLARKKPALLVLDDLQWADAPSLLALRLIARSPVNGLLIVATIRTDENLPPAIDQLVEDLRRNAHTVLTLAGLAEQDVASIARNYGIDAGATTQAIHRASGGNPLFARELLLDESARRALVDGKDPPLPRGVRAVLTSKLAKLGVGRVEILAFAAMGPQPLEVDLVARAFSGPVDDVLEALHAAQGCGFLTRAPDGTLRFAHDLMLLAARDEIPTARRVKLHQGWARVLEGSTDTNKLTAGAYHALAVDPTTCSEQVRDRVVAAGIAASERMSYEEAAGLFELAAAVDDRADRCGAAARSLARAAEAWAYAGDPALGKQIAERAVTLARQAGDPLALASAAVAVGLRRTLSSTDPGLVALLEDALRELEEAPQGTIDVSTMCAVEARLASALQPFANPARALTLGRRSIERARATKDEALLARTIHAARPAFRIFDDLNERLNMDSELLFLANKLGDILLAMHARARLCFISIESGDALALDAHLDAYQTLADEIHLAQHDVAATAIRALRATIRGDTEDAQRLIQCVDQMRDRWTSSTLVLGAVDPVVVLRGALAVVTGDPIGYSALGTAPTAPFMRSMFALFAATRLGRVREISELYGHVVERVLSPESANFSFRAILANAIVALRDVEGAKRLLPMLEPYRGRHVVWAPFTLYDGSIDRLRGGLANVLGDHGLAASCFEDAIASEDAFLARPFAERTRRERDATINVDARSAARISAKVSAISAAWSLTPRQRDVLGLLARGLANAVIAAELGIGVRAVELHVTALFDRAGVDNRSALVAKVMSM